MKRLASVVKVVLRRAVSLLVATVSVSCAAAAPPPTTPPAPPPPAEKTAPTQQPGAAGSQPSEADIKAALGPAERFAVSIDAQPCRGKSDASLTVVEFGDYGSPFVRRVQPIIAKLLSDFSVRHCFRNFPVRKENEFADLAAEVGEEVLLVKGAEAFWQFHETMMTRPLNNLTAVLSAASGSGLPEGWSQETLSTKRRRLDVAADQQALAQLQFNGIPVVFINGRAVRGAVAYEKFAAIVEEELTTTRALEQLGLKSAQIYSTVLAHAKSAVAAPRLDPYKPSQIEVEAIVITSEGNGHPPQNRTREEARERANKVAARLKANGDFLTLLKEYSNASDAAVGGPGRIGQHYYDDDALNQAAFSLQPGQIVGPIESKGTFFFFRRVR